MSPIIQIHNLDLPNFRKKQLFHGIFAELNFDFSSYTNLPKDLKVQLSENLQIITLKTLKVLVSSDKSTIKWSFLTTKSNPIEAVLMMHKNGRNTLCVSCQSGCPVNCSFCSTGKMGFNQNLTAWEIIEQVLIANKWLKDNIKERGKVTRVVYMGMGEPMLNVREVSASIKILNNPDFFGIGPRSITVSTSGYIPQMKEFWAEFPKIGLAISLHAPNQELREKLMPVAKVFDLKDLIEVCKEIQRKSSRRATYEYILIENITDTDECAEELIELLKGQLAHVNLIPYNPIYDKDEFKRPSRNRVMHFANLLKSRGLSATPRVTMGDDIKAACGQLSNS